MQKKRMVPILESRKLLENQLVTALKKALPASVELIAHNFSRAGTSLYGLLCCKQKEGTVTWLTMRLADHPLWLQEAQQISIGFGNPAELNRLEEKISQLFQDPKWKEYFYEISPLETAVLEFLDECQKLGLIWAVRLPEEIFIARKQVPLHLKSDFMRADLFLVNRNNLNKLLLPVEAKKFQSDLAVLFGRNLLFSQFSRGDLLRLLPTNQWIQPIIEQEKVHQNGSWNKWIAEAYGEHLVATFEKSKTSAGFH